MSDYARQVAEQRADRAALARSCPKCGAQPGQHCCAMDWINGQWVVALVNGHPVPRDPHIKRYQAGDYANAN